MRRCGGRLCARRCACATAACPQVSCRRFLSRHRNCWRAMCSRDRTCGLTPAVFRCRSDCASGRFPQLHVQVTLRYVRQSCCHARTAVPSDPASSVLFLGRPSSRSSSMSWSRPTTSAGDDVARNCVLSRDCVVLVLSCFANRWQIIVHNWRERKKGGAIGVCCAEQPPRIVGQRFWRGLRRQRALSVVASKQQIWRRAQQASAACFFVLVRFSQLEFRADSRRPPRRSRCKGCFCSSNCSSAPNQSQGTQS